MAYSMNRTPTRTTNNVLPVISKCIFTSKESPTRVLWAKSY